MAMACCESSVKENFVEYPIDAGVPVIKETFDGVVEVECNDVNTRHFRHKWCYKHNRGNLVERPQSLPKDLPLTVASMTMNAAKMHADKPVFGTRKITKEVQESGKKYWWKDSYEWVTYGEVFAEIKDIAKGLLGLEGIMDLKKAHSCTAAILADTSAEWQMAAQAAFQVGLPITTVYTTLGHEAMVYGLAETEAPVLFLDWIQFAPLEKPVLCKLPKLKHVVLIGKCWVPGEVVGGTRNPFPSAAEAWAMKKECAAKLTTFEGLIHTGKGHGTSSLDLASHLPEEKDVAFVMYTSGSTGMPKGVMLSQTNFCASVAGSEAQAVLYPSNTDIGIAYLPLAHIFELFVEVTMMHVGGKIGYGSPKTLSSASVFMHPDNPEGSDLLGLRPTLFPAVPAVLDLIKAGLITKLKNMEGFKGQLVRTAINHAQGLDGMESPVASMLSTVGMMKPILNKVKVQAGLDRIRYIGSGGAPLAPATQHFVATVLAPCAQGLGCTETTGAITMLEIISRDGRPKDTTTGTVGCVTPNAEFKLKSVPEMNYHVTGDPPQGEILLGGFNVSQMGYLNNKEKTAQDLPFHGDGRRWFHTGDVGELRPNGALKIIDRKKDLIKLSGGEFVSLGKVENALKQVEGIGACVVFVKPDKDYCVAIVSQPERGWKIVGGKPDEVTLIKKIGESLRAQGLARFEIPTNVKVDDMIWTPESGLMTASMKLQRVPLRKYYNSPGGLLAQMDYAFAS